MSAINLRVGEAPSEIEHILLFLCLGRELGKQLGRRDHMACRASQFATTSTFNIYVVLYRYVQHRLAFLCIHYYRILIGFLYKGERDEAGLNKLSSADRLPAGNNA